MSTYAERLVDETIWVFEEKNGIVTMTSKMWDEVLDREDALRAKLDETTADLNVWKQASVTAELTCHELQSKLDEWKAAHDNLAQQLSTTNDLLDVAVEALRALLYVTEMRRDWDILPSDEFDEAYPDEYGWAFGDVDENMVQKIIMATDALAKLEEK